MMPKATTKQKTKTASPRARASQGPAYLLRRSSVHGTGLFATRTIATGDRFIEYLGEITREIFVEHSN